MDDEFFNTYAGADEEEFKLMPGYEDYYVVSNMGYILSTRTDTILTPTIKDKGYFYLKIIGKDNAKTCSIHQIIASTFLEKPTHRNGKKLIIDHINGIRTDNRAENLRWVTISENGKNAHKNNKNMGKGGKRALKPVYQLDKDGNIIQEFASVNDAAASVNINGARISECCHGQRKEAGGFGWKLKKIKIKLLPGEKFRPMKPIKKAKFPDIEISTHGRFRNKKTGRLLAVIKNGGAYQQVTLYCHKKNKYTFTVHRLVALNFLAEPKSKSKNVVNHIDENKQNNHYKNLEWVTNRQNIVHSCGKRVHQIDRNTGEIIKTYDSIRAASRAMGRKTNSNISQVCKGIRPSVFGYCWMEADD